VYSRLSQRECRARGFAAKFAHGRQDRCADDGVSQQWTSAVAVDWLRTSQRMNKISPPFQLLKWVHYPIVSLFSALELKV
jgi:hypothetical protein